MAWRRKRQAHPIELVFQAVGIVLFLCAVSPQARQGVSASLHFAIPLLAVVGISAGGYRLYRWKTGSKRDAATVAADFVNADRENPRDLFPTANWTEQLRAIDWYQFEQLVALLYRKLGYSVIRRGGANPDGGIDLIIEREGQPFAVQCKHWKSWDVGVKPVREFLGALTDSGIKSGIIITLCGYTGEAKRLADKHGIEIINETGLTKMLESTDARFDPEALAILHDMRKLCPKCGAAMVLRTATTGAGFGKQFWGCSKYPGCRFTMKKA